MTQPFAENDPFKHPKSEAMMAILRDDLSQQKPSAWGALRQRHNNFITGNGSLIRTSPEIYGATPSIFRHKNITCRSDNGSDLLGTRKQKIVKVLKMMGPPNTSPRYFSKEHPSCKTDEKRLPTRGSRLSLDPELLASSVQRRESAMSLPRDFRKRHSLRSKQLSQRRLSQKQVNNTDVHSVVREPSPVLDSHSANAEPKLASCQQKRAIRGRFKKLAKLLILLLRGWRLHSKKVHEILDGFGSEGGHTHNEETNDDFMFDLAYYKVKKEEKLPSEIQLLLRKRPKDRTAGEINKLQLAFKNYRSIVSYPTGLQQMIAQRAWYETYGAKKVMVREGHPPMQFYFILSGSAVVCVMGADSRLKTIVQIGRGDHFGELAMINRSRRQSTVISQDQIELLCLTDQDFIDIFMSGGLNDPKDSFLLSLWYLETWPIPQLIEHPEKALISYFQRHTVLVPDSNSSDWLYIIKSGSCEVLKSLKKRNLPTQPKLPPKLKDFREEVLENLRQGDPKYLSHEQLLQLRLEKQIEKIAQENTRLRHFLPEINISTDEAYQNLRSNKREPSDFVKRKPDKEKSTMERLVSQKPHMSVSKRLTQAKSGNQTVEEFGDFTTLKDDLLLRLPGNGDRESRDLVRRGAINVKRPPQKYKFDKNSILVALGTLTKGEVFGLHELVYQHQPSMCLVSNGAEIVMINKKFYLEHASDSLIRKLRTEVIAFPSEQKLQSMLEADTNWEHLRKISLRESVERLKFKKVNINDARSRYPKANSQPFP